MKCTANRKILIPIISLIIGAAAIITAAVFIILSNKTTNQQPISSESTELISSDGDFDYSWLDKSPYIAHAFGGISGKSYTNSYEAFLLNYQLGHRVFEADFYLTDNNIPVLQHDTKHWREITNSSTNTPFTYDNFRSKLIYDEFHGVDCEQLIHIMSEHPDIYLVTDTKYTDKENTDRVLGSIIEYANQIDPSVLDRFIIQIYNEEMFDWVMEAYSWKSIIYTLYQSPGWTPENVLAFSERTGVNLITIPDEWLTEEIANLWNDANISIAVHTLNELGWVKHFQSMGVDSIYTDFLIP